VRSKFWRQHTRIVKRVLGSKTDHVTQKEVKDTGQTSTIVDTPPPSGQGDDGTAEMIQTMHDIHSWAMQEIIEQDRICRAQYEEWRKREQCRIYCERYNSPLAPYTQLMQDEAARVGSTIYMCPAVAYKESSMCHACFRPFNGWGLMGYWPSSWEEGIHDFYQFLWDWNISRGYAAVSGMTTPNYCEPWPGSWAPEVDAHIREIQAIEVAPYKSGP
jgi:hypothetical protein